MFPNTYSRRIVGQSLIAGALGVGALGSIGSAKAHKGRASGDPGFDIHDPGANLNMLIKLLGDTSGAPVVGWYNGHVFGVRGDEKVRPLFGFEGFGTGRFEQQEDGSYRQIWREVAVYRDIETGEILAEWLNPYTGEVVEPLDVQNDPVNQMWRTVTPELPPIPDLDFTFGNYGHGGDMVLPWTIDIVGDWASVNYDVIGRRRSQLDPEVWKRESPGPFARVMECFQYGGTLSELNDPEVTSVRFAGGWQRLADWLPWMLMDQADGHLFYRATTRQLENVEHLPADLLAHAKMHYPEFLIPPTEWSFETESSFDVYKRKRTPAPPKQ